MAINLITWANQTVTPKDDAIVQDACAGRSGILYGCGVTASGNTLTVASGYGIIKGRLFEVTSDTLSITLPSSGTLKGVLYLKLDLSNSAEPLRFIAVANSTQYQVQQDANVNFDSGVFELEMATFDVSSSGISNLTKSESKVPYNRSPIYQSLKDLGINGSNLYPAAICDGYMANSSIAILQSTDVASQYLPYDGAVGMIVIIKGRDAEHAKILFLSEYGKPNYQYSKRGSQWYTEWKKLPAYEDLYYNAQNHDFYVCTGGVLTSGGTKIIFSVPLAKSALGYSRVSLFEGGVTVRQNGKYLMGTGDSTDALYNGYTYTLRLRTNCIEVEVIKAGGFDGINNACVHVIGNLQLYFN